MPWENRKDSDASPQPYTHPHRVMDKSKSIVAMHSDSAFPNERFWLSRASGEIQCLSIADPDLNLSFNCTSVPIGLGMSDGNVFTCTKTGQVELRNFTDDSIQSSPVISVNVGTNIQVARLNPGKPHLFATGGVDRPLSIFDLNALTHQSPQQKPVPLYKSKGLGNDHLDLPRTTNITDLSFLPDSPAHVLTADKFGWIRLYDTRDPAKRKPVVEYAITEATNFSSTTKTQRKFTCPTHVGYPIRRLIVPTDRMAVLSDTTGNVHQVDFRAGKTLGAFKGIAGAVSDIQFDGSNVATVGLDRHLRIYSWNSRSLLKKVYLKQRLTSVLFIGDQTKAGNADNDDDGSDAEDIWEQMEMEAGSVKSSIK